MIDITAPDHYAEVVVNAVSGTVHVNVDGVCRLRICRVPDGKIRIVRQGRRRVAIREAPDSQED